MHILVLLDTSEVSDLVPVTCGPLELKGGRGRLHLLFESRQHVAALALEKHDGQADVLRVLLAADQADAGRAAAVDLVLQARSRAVLEEAVLAGTNAEESLQDVEAVAHGRRARKRPEVPTAFLGAAMEGKPRERMVCQLDEGIGLVVAQDNVETRLLGLDQALFEE